MNRIFNTFKLLRQKLLDIDLKSLAKKNKSTKHIMYEINKKPKLYLIENIKKSDRKSKENS